VTRDAIFIHTAFLGFQAIQKTATIHPGSGVIWGNAGSSKKKICSRCRDLSRRWASNGIARASFERRG
jgi:hypothetical protein